MIRKLFIALSLVFTACLVHAQTSTTISASDVADSFGHPIASASLCFQPVDATDTATGFRVDSIQVVDTPVCGLVSNGVLQAGLSVVPTPSGIYYHITAQNRTSNAVIRDYGMTQITGSSWTLDSYDPSTAVLPVSAITMGTVTTLPAGDDAYCNLSGGSPLLLNCGIPQGETGATGASGAGIAAATQEMVDNFTRANQTGWGNSSSGQTWGQTGSCDSAIISDAGTVAQSSFPINCYNTMNFTTTPDRYSATFSMTEVNPSGTTNTSPNNVDLTMINDVLGQSVPVGQAIHVIQNGAGITPTWWTGSSQDNFLQFCTSTESGFTAAANTQYPIAITRQGSWLEVEEMGGFRAACYDPNVATNWPSGGATGIWQMTQQSTDVYEPLITAAEADVMTYNFEKGAFEFAGGLQGTNIGTETPAPIGIFNSLFVKSQDASMAAPTAMVHIYNDQNIADTFTVENSQSVHTRLKTDGAGYGICQYFDLQGGAESSICSPGVVGGLQFNVSGSPWLTLNYTGQIIATRPFLAPNYEWQGTGSDYWNASLYEIGAYSQLNFTYSGAGTNLSVNFPSTATLSAGGFVLAGGGGVTTNCWNTNGGFTACAPPVTYPTGILYGNNTTSAPTAATSSQVQTAIGSGVYDASGSAAARAAASTCTSGQYATGTGTSSTPCAQVAYSQVSGTPTPTLSGTAVTLGGSSVSAHTCTSGTTSVTGATTSMAVVVSAASDPGGYFNYRGTVTSSGTVTVYLCNVNTSTAETPTSTTYIVRVIE